MSIPLCGQIVTAPDGCLGFDCNVPLTQSQAGAFAAHGYKFVARYVPRITHRSYDLTHEEAAEILGAGLGLMIVQHVESADSWVPSHEKGTGYGHVASEQAAAIGCLPGTTVWLDLEGVALGTPAQAVIDYCNQWYAVVSTNGFLPGLYTGWRAGLSAQQLYRNLRFPRYWGSYNINSDQIPAVRGLCMKQRAGKPADKPPGITLEFDVNTTHVDALGGRASLLVPPGWTP